MTQYKYLATMSVAAIVFFSAASYGQELVYRFDPELGVPYKGVATTETRTQTQVQGMDLDVTMTMRLEQDVVFEEGDDDTVVGRYTVSSMSAEFGGMPGMDQMPFDVNDLYEGMVGNTLTMVTNRSGQVVDFSGLEEMMDAMMDRLEMPEEMKAMIREGIESNLGGGQIKDLVQQGVPFVPARPLESGDTWTDSVNAFGMKVEAVYTLGERSDGVAMIQVAGELSATDGAGFPGMLNAPGVEMRIENLSGSYTGSYELDEATGLASSYSLDMDMSMDMEMPQLGGAQGESSSMSMSMQTATKGELRRAE